MLRSIAESSSTTRTTFLFGKTDFLAYRSTPSLLHELKRYEPAKLRNADKVRRFSLNGPRITNFLLSDRTIGRETVEKSLRGRYANYRIALTGQTRSARDTSSAKVWTCIFSITLWRWALIVRSVVPKLRPICLPVLPR